ncbi:MAG: hypothetical protein J6K97_03300 [Clostridia bacterium]|nr:hypothetical protein [Clostridia bacterium]
MNFIKKIWDKIKYPHGAALALFYIFFVLLTAGTVVLVVFKPQQTVWHFILYCFAAAALAYFVYTIILFAPKMKENTIKQLKKHKFTNSMLESYGYRTITFGIFSFTVNISFVIFQGVFAIMTGSIWYITITCYYLVLTLIKGLVLYSKWKNKDNIQKQAKTYMWCGIAFLILTFAFSGMILLIYKSNMYFEYAGLMIYVVAVYTFYKLTLAIVNIFKAKKQDDFYVKSIRNINLASALVSVVVLQVALFQSFSPASNLGVANALTGGGVSLVILAYAIIMITKANKILKQEKNDDGKQK